MVDFLTKPAVVKALLGSVTGLLLICAGLAGTTFYFEGRYRTEVANHKATYNELAGKLAIANTTVSLLQADKTADAGIIKGLRDQVTATLDTLERQREAAASRAAIAGKAKSVPARDKEVVDDATSREVIRHLNRSLRHR